MAQAVSRRPLTAEGRARSQVSPCEIYGGQSSPGTGFSPSTSVCPVIQPMLLSHLHLHVVVTRTNGRNQGTFQNPAFFRQSLMIKSRKRLAALKGINLFCKLRGVWEGVDWIQPAQDGNNPSGSTKCRGFNYRLRH